MTDTIDVKFDTIIRNYYSGHISAAEYVVNEQSVWEDLWALTNSDIIPKPDLPEIDFSKEMVLGVYFGQKNTGGYDIEISKVQEKDSCLEVYVIESYPTPGDITTRALSQPFHLVKTKLSKKDVKFIK